MSRTRLVAAGTGGQPAATKSDKPSIAVRLSAAASAPKHRQSRLPWYTPQPPRQLHRASGFVAKRRRWTWQTERRMGCGTEPDDRPTGLVLRRSIRRIVRDRQGGPRGARRRNNRLLRISSSMRQKQSLRRRNGSMAIRRRRNRAASRRGLRVPVSAAQRREPQSPATTAEPRRQAAKRVGGRQCCSPSPLRHDAEDEQDEPQFDPRYRQARSDRVQQHVQRSTVRRRRQTVCELEHARVQDTGEPCWRDRMPQPLDNRASCATGPSTAWLRLGS